MLPFPSPGDLSDPGIKPTSPVDVADRFFNLSHLGSLLAAAGAKSLPSIMASLAAQLVKNLPGMRETWVRSKGWEDPLEKGNATHSSILAWRTPWKEESGGLWSIGPQRVGHD